MLLVSTSPSHAGTGELIEELELLLKRRIIGTKELKRMQQALLDDELINPIELPAGPDPELLAADARIQTQLDEGRVEPIWLREWLYVKMTALGGSSRADALQVAQNVATQGQPLTPFNVIRHLGNVNLDGFMRFGLIAAWHGRIPSTGKAGSLFTSCTNTVLVLPLIFVGFERARKLLRAISTDTLLEWAVKLAGDETFVLEIEGLFDGTLPTDVEERVALRDRGAEAVALHVWHSPLGARRFERHLAPGVEAIKGSATDVATQRDLLCEFLREPSFSFNQVIIDRMRQEMKSKCSLIGPEHSFLYVIFGRMRNPLPTMQHAFLIEHFVAEGVPCFRLHGSWIYEGTFVDNIRRQREFGSEIWDVKALEVFLKNLEHAYCKQMDGSTLYRCFGFGLNERERPLVQFEANCLHGIALAYVVMPFNPTQAVDHLAELINYGLSL